MPNRKFHMIVGAAVGAGEAGYYARNEPLPGLIAETIGGGIGGAFGGRLPDLLEPASRGPNHRSHLHSVAAGLCVGAIHYLSVPRIQRSCRARAIQCEESLRSASGWLQQAWIWLQGIFWRLLSGIAAGIGGGYISHLGADGFTPKRLPLC